MEVTSMVTTITNNDFSAAANSEFALVDFSATWCGPCRMVAPIVHELAEEIDEVAFFNCDVDENPDIAAQFGIESIPTIVILKNGQPVSKVVGFRPKPDLESWIRQSIG